MAILRPSLKFKGSDLDETSIYRYIKPDIRQVIFDKKNSADGLWLYFLPPYTLDEDGNGKWFHTFTLRSEVGNAKRKYVAKNIERDPTIFFGKKLKQFYPDLAEIVEGETQWGKRKIYPASGKSTRRVVYNVLNMDKMDAGSQVLELPSYNGGDKIMEWLGKKNKRGEQNPLLNDTENGFVPVHVAKDDSMNPWKITPDITSITPVGDDDGCVPSAYCDSDYLYNLEDVFVDAPSDEELINILRDSYEADVFERCIAGHPGAAAILGTVSMATPRAAAAPQRTAPKPTTVAAQPPKANIPSAIKAVVPVKTITSAAPAADDSDVDYTHDDDGKPVPQAEVVRVETSGNPTARKPGMAPGAARDFLRSKQ